MSPNDPRDDIAPEDADDVRAGEYVLGVLDGPDRAAAALRLASDRDFAARVGRWEAFLAPLASPPEPVAAPEAVWSRLQSRLEPAPVRDAPPRPAISGRTGARRSPARLAWAAALVGAVVLGALGWAMLGPARVSPALVAVLAPAAAAPADSRGVVAVYTGEGRLAPAFAAAPRPGRAAELWLIKPGAAPVALGLVGSGQFAKAADSIRGARVGDVVAVSSEPPGGSPGPSPTGPVVATGVLQAL